MSITAFEFLAILESENSKKEEQESSFNYLNILEKVRSEIAQKHAKELAEVLDSKAASIVLKDLILKYTLEYITQIDIPLNDLVEKIYLDMAGLGILSEYLNDEEVEEININSYNLIEIIYGDYIKYLADEQAFRDATAALDIVKRMVRMGGKILDAQSPMVDSYIGNSTRISAMIPPAVASNVAVVASIRKQNQSSMSKERLIKSKSVSADMLDFLSICLCNGVSIGLAGGTGSGKTTDEAFLLNEYIKNNDDYNNRIYIIEDSRELNLIKEDSLNNRLARIIYATTKEDGKAINMCDHIVEALRFHPKLIVPSEVRDKAAYLAASAGETGHTILTSFHADNAIDAYERLVTMCHLANTGIDDERLLKMCVRAWPIMVYKKQLKDRSRKYMEIFEATGVNHGALQGQMLYRFVISENERDEKGRIIKVKGEHKRVGNISQKLFNKLKDNGVEEKELLRLFPKGGVR